jgi:hypothetical protein
MSWYKSVIFLLGLLKLFNFVIQISPHFVPEMSTSLMSHIVARPLIPTSQFSSTVNLSEILTWYYFLPSKLFNSWDWISPYIKQELIQILTLTFILCREFKTVNVIIMVMGLLVDCNTCFIALSICSVDHNQRIFQLTQKINQVISK